LLVSQSVVPLSLSACLWQVSVLFEGIVVNATELDLNNQ
jgi:hypothetical protein